MVQKGDVKTVTITSLAPGGEGVSKDLGIALFVDRTAPGDTVEVEIFDARKGFAKAALKRIIEPSKQRDQPPCPLFNVCGGCQWQHLGYEHQLTAKTDLVRQTVKHIGGLDPSIVLPTIGADPLHYRNKAQFPVKNPKGSTRLLAGYYKVGSHELVNIKHCPVQPELLDRVLEAVKDLCETFEIDAYEEKQHRGLLRHINFRYSFATGKTLVTLVLNLPADEIPDEIEGVAEGLMSLLPEVSGVCVNLNPSRGNRILGETTVCIAGDPYIEEMLRTDDERLPQKNREGLRFRLSSSSFFQVNTQQAVTLMESLSHGLMKIAETWNEQTSNLTIVDAYAGVGPISLWLAPMVDRVVAIESHPDAVADGRENARLNELGNVEFKLAAVEDELPSLIQGGFTPDVIVVDPPRKGLSPEVVKSLLESGARAILYVSCNPATLARDLKMLDPSNKDLSLDEDETPHETSDMNERANGYKTIQIQPVDLFPQTYHVESVSTLIRR